MPAHLPLVIAVGLLGFGQGWALPTLVRAIINMAHHMDLATTAEGIEDAATQALLIDMGCDFGQGFHLGRPQPAADFIARFATTVPPA